MEKSRVLPRIPEPPVSARARARLPRTEGSRHALSSPQPSLGGPRGEATGDPRGPSACSPAATTLRGPGAKVPRAAGPGSRAPASPSPAAHLRRSPGPRSRRRGERTPARPASAGPATRQVQLCGPVASGGPHSGAGGPRRDRGQPPRAYLSHSFDGHGGAPRPRGDGGAGGGPGGCAARRLPTFPPPALPGEPTGRAASAPVRTRRAAFHRGRRRRGARGPSEGARRCPPAPRSPPAAAPRGRSWVRGWEGLGPQGCPWPDAGSSVGNPVAGTGAPPNTAPSPGRL